MPGHSSTKLTEIYTHGQKTANNVMKSPLDFIDILLDLKRTYQNISHMTIKDIYEIHPIGGMGLGVYGCRQAKGDSTI